MKTVTGQTHYAAFRFGLISAAGGSKGLQPRVSALRDAPTIADVSEFLDGTGDVLSRRVKTSTGEEFWLRADIAEKAALKLLEEAAENNRIAQEVCRWSLERDIEAARKADMTVEAYRQRRLAVGHRQHQRSGKSSIGMG